MARKRGRRKEDNPLAFPLRVRLNAALHRKLELAVTAYQWGRSATVRKALNLGLDAIAEKKLAWDAKHQKGKV